MPRPVGSKNKKTPKPIFSAKGNDAPMVPLTKDGQNLFNDVSARWKLDIVSERLLRLACESISEAERFNLLLEEKGRSFTDRFGVVKPSDLAKQEASHRATAVSCLNKLQQVLGEE
jgi:hypothetical protein